MFEDWIYKILAHDGEIIQFFPYQNLFYKSVFCWMIVEPFFLENRLDLQGVNIKLYSTKSINNEDINSNIMDFDRIVFFDNTEINLKNNCVIIEAEKIKTIENNTTAKVDGGLIQNINQYGYYEFNLISKVDFGVEHLPPIGRVSGKYISVNGKMLVGFKSATNYQ